MGIWVKIFISVIWLKLYRIVKVTYEHTLPVHMAAFMAFLSEKKRPKWTLSRKSQNFNKNQKNFRISVENEKKLMKSPLLD